MGLKQNLTIGAFVLMALIGTTFIIVDTDKAYYCEATNVVGYCNDLSKKNSDGLQTRCYYNESSPKKYKICKTGWEKFKELEVNGTIIDYKYEGIEMNLTKNKKDKLKTKGINDPEIIRLKNRFNMCVFNIFEEGGINKEITFECSYCVQYGWNETEQMNTSECVDYYQMSQIEIETNLNNQVEEFLIKLSEIKDKRDSKNNESLSDKLSFTLNEKK